MRDIKEALMRLHLKNGATILFEERRLPIAAIIVATKAGAAYETKNLKGMAHFTEHMLFKGSKTRGQKAISSSIEKAGGILNGFTAEQITAFWCKMPSRKTSLGAEILLDMFSNPRFDSKEIEKEKGVIVSEIRRTHDLPMNFLFDKIKELLYKEPFALPVLGSKETVMSFNQNSFKEWHNKFYGAENSIVSVVGKAEIEEIENIVKKLNSYQKNLLKVNIFSSGKNIKFIEKRKDLEQTHIAIAFNVPKLSEEGRHAADLFNAILGRGMSSWLFQEVREKKGWAYTIKSFLEQEKDYGHCIVYAGINKENLKKVKEIILKEISKFKSLKQKDLEEAKEQCIGNWQLELEDSERTAANVTMQEIATKAEDFYIYDEKISDVRLEDVKRIARIKNYVTAAIIPK